MSSYQLSLQAPLGSSSTLIQGLRLCTPIYAAFSPSSDVVAVLWELGHVELWELHTRLGPGRNKVMNPVKIWGGWLNDDRQEFKQIKLWTTETLTMLICRVAVLASARDGSNMLAVAEIGEGNLIQTDWVQLPKHNGRLVDSDGAIVWQAYDGELYDGASSQNRG